MTDLEKAKKAKEVSSLGLYLYVERIDLSDEDNILPEDDKNADIAVVHNPPKDNTLDLKDGDLVVLTPKNNPKPLKDPISGYEIITNSSVTGIITKFDK